MQRKPCDQHWNRCFSRELALLTCAAAAAASVLLPGAVMVRTTSGRLALAQTAIRNTLVLLDAAARG